MRIFTRKEVVGTLLAALVLLLAIILYPRYDRQAESPLPPIAATPVEALPEERAPEPPQELPYVEITDGCGPYHQGACINLRAGPETEHPAVMKLRSGMVLRALGSVENEGRLWYKVGFDEWLRYPDRLPSDLYVAAEFVTPFFHEPPSEIPAETPASGNKRILVDRSEQMLYAYEGEEVYMKEAISTGLALTPTPRGSFIVFRKTPSRYMQGPLPGISEDEYDLPGVPWNLYFTEQGAAIHGTYWHDSFGLQWSHGCVNLPPEKARMLYEWADLGTAVVVRD